MFVRRPVALLLSLVALAGCMAQGPGTRPEAPQAARQGALAEACEGRDGWSDTAPPAHVFGNVYVVGTCGIVSLLVTTRAGHFLIDGATAKAAPAIAENIRKLGFNPRDVRYLLSSHEHLDHVGGLAELKRLTGAKMVARAEAKAALESGMADATDPQRGGLPPFEGIKVDRLIRDGDRIALGNLSLTAMATPGHTSGGTSWTWKACEGAVCRTIVYADSLSAVSASGYRFSDHPAYVATLRASIDRVAALQPCDILITPHPSSGFFERLAGKGALIDTTRCADYADKARARLEARLASEAQR